MKKTFLFYDTETSGLNPAFDQILTFAAIRTDLALNEIEREMITVRLRPDIVPSPRAFLTHGLTIDELEKGICEYQAALKIHKIVNTPGTMSLGYNTLGFDDEFLRFLFYRNLLDPYTHQYNNGCARLDILPITVLYRLFKPDILKWPVVEGKPSLKLENISKINEFQTTGRAHEAMSDVEAVIALSRIFYQIPESWAYALDFFNKTRDDVRIASIKKDFQVGLRFFPVCLMISSAFGPQCNYMAPVLGIGSSKPYKNQTLWLRLDKKDMLGIENDVPIEDLFVIRKRSADEMIVLPPLQRFRDKLSDETLPVIEQNMNAIRANEERFFEMVEYNCNYKYPYVPQMDMDAALYQDGFFSAFEKKQCAFCHKALADGDFDAVGQLKSERVRGLARRIMYRNFTKDFGQADGTDTLSHIRRLKSDRKEDQIIGYKNDVKFNLQMAKQQLREIDTQHNDMSPEQSAVIKVVRKYLNQFA